MFDAAPFGLFFLPAMHVSPGLAPRPASERGWAGARVATAENYCFVPPNALPTEPGLRDHLLRMRELRPGLQLHTDDARDQRDLTAQTEISEGLRIVLLLEGTVDVAYGTRRVALSGSSGGATALMVSVVERDQFTRHVRKGGYARRVNLGLGWDWLLQAAGHAGAVPSAALTDFKRQHLAMQQWKMSQRAMVIAEQIVRPPLFEPLLQNLYLESRALELVAEAVGALHRHPAAPPPPAAPSALRPQEHRRMRELREFLATGQADLMSLDEIAHHVGTNANTLQRQFRATHGTTVFDYLRECRLQRARQVLERDGLTVGQAAMVAGYTSAANFATAYKRRFGLSPKLARGRL